MSGWTQEMRFEMSAFFPLTEQKLNSEGPGEFRIRNRMGFWLVDRWWGAVDWVENWGQRGDRGKEKIGTLEWLKRVLGRFCAEAVKVIGIIAMIILKSVKLAYNSWLGVCHPIVKKRYVWVPEKTGLMSPKLISCKLLSRGVFLLDLHYFDKLQKSIKK